MFMSELNVFLKIVQGIIPCQKVWEDSYTLCFKDVSPKAPVHVLLIPKGEYLNALEFYKNASTEEILSFQKGIVEVVELLGLEKNGFRAITNQGNYGHQEVPHFHLHILGAK
ncbi:MULTISPECIES: HIT domain-containing protein [Holospora]|uniref:Putative HIT-like protein n=2 Tax=Holospora TaxID=44747 RepID=A0A061JIB9_9PROT|nr:MULTISPECIES: HIT domain-containing protein [Holospora]ETZ05278.1 putative HIT-like protein [Holospora undulata HU1]GAJ46638.1 putative HIT-like protein RP317 [Holospora elegans E1]GAJ46847.1 putative HIT-like protein RP317 [Holospora elegans E1]